MYLCCVNKSELGSPVASHKVFAPNWPSNKFFSVVTVDDWYGSYDVPVEPFSIWMSDTTISSSAPVTDSMVNWILPVESVVKEK